LISEFRFLISSLTYLLNDPIAKVNNPLEDYQTTTSAGLEYSTNGLVLCHIYVASNCFVFFVVFCFLFFQA